MELIMKAKECVPDNEVWVSPKTYNLEPSEPKCPSQRVHSKTCRIDGQKCNTDTAYECPMEGGE